MILPNASCTDVVCPKCLAEVDMVCSPGDGVTIEGQPHEARVAFASTVRANARSRPPAPVLPHGHTKHPWTQTHSGLVFDLESPTVAMVQLDDIGHALSLQCRYNGHCTFFYTVAQHSLLVARLIETWGGDTQMQLEGLLHDAHEAYTGDVIAPAKRLIPGWAAFEDRIESVVRLALGLAPEMPDLVKRADLVMLAIERKYVMRPSERSWDLPLPADTRFDADDFTERLWESVRAEFLTEAARLRGAL